MLFSPPILCSIASNILLATSIVHMPGRPRYTMPGLVLLVIIGQSYISTCSIAHDCEAQTPVLQGLYNHIVHCILYCNPWPTQLHRMAFYCTRLGCADPCITSQHAVSSDEWLTTVVGTPSNQKVQHRTMQQEFTTQIYEVLHDIVFYYILHGPELHCHF